MTEATLTHFSRRTPTQPTLEYQVSLSRPESHFFEVILRVRYWQSPTLDLKFPVWTPGSYLVREYVRHLQNFVAQAEDETPLKSVKRSKNHWWVETPGVENLTIRYRIFANELTVRTNHLDATHGYFNGAALFFRIPGLEKTPIEVKIIPPDSSWQVVTPLVKKTEADLSYIAKDFDTLVDSPFEIGKPQLYHFEVLGKSHKLAVWGEGNFAAGRAIRDFEKIIETEAKIFGGLPYSRYVFLLHLTEKSIGGLEHKDACSLIYPRFGFRENESYQRFMQLVAHEFFHLWNVKRIRPKGLEVFDYDQENYTPSLWFCEGTTSYYDMVIPLRAGIYDAKAFLKELGKEITRLQTTPGRLVQPLQESSWDAWIKLYRQDAYSNNSQISYYLKGELVSLLLDLRIRLNSENTRSLDDVLRQLWVEFGQPEVGFTPEQLQQCFTTVAGENLDSFFATYLDTTTELPFNEYLEPFGLRLQADFEPNCEGVPYLGMTVKTEYGKEKVKSVIAGSPAAQAGIDPGDELLALEQLRVTADQLNDRLRNYQVGDAIALTLFRQDQLMTVSVTLGTPQPNRYQVVAVENPTPAQMNRFAGWLGVPFTQVFSSQG